MDSPRAAQIGTADATKTIKKRSCVEPKYGAGTPDAPPAAATLERVRAALDAASSTSEPAFVVEKARVPVATVALAAGLRVDVVCNFSAGLGNSAVLAEIARRRPQLAPLVRCARAFSRQAGVVGNRRRHLSAYAWTLLCVRVLQRRGELPPLPLVSTKAAVARGPTAGAGGYAAAAAADLDEAGVAAVEESDGLADRFLDLLRLVAFSKGADVEALAGASPSPAPAGASRKRDRLRLEDPLEADRDLGAVRG